MRRDKIVKKNISRFQVINQVKIPGDFQEAGHFRRVNLQNNKHG